MRAEPRPVAVWTALLFTASVACSETPYDEVRLSEVRGSAPAAAAPAARPRLRFSVAAMESPRDTYVTYAHLIDRMSARLGRAVELVQRRTYREVNDLLATGQLDAALVCAGGYLDLSTRAPNTVEVLAVPVIEGKPSFRALIIVPAAGPARKVADLAGRRFAYTDELSLSGHAYPVWLLRRSGRDPDRFFSSVIYTQSHDRSIVSIAKGIVDGAAVHSAILDHVVRERPEIARKIRVIDRSTEFGSMPVVASTRLPPEERARLRETLLRLHEDPDAAAALRVLNIERFEAPVPGLFAHAAKVVEAAR